MDEKGKRNTKNRKKTFFAVVCVLLLIGAINEAFISEEDLIEMIGLAEEQVWKEFGKPDRREAVGGVNFGYYNAGFNYVTRLDGMITAVSLTDSKREILGISAGDSEVAVKEAMENQDVLWESQDIVTEDGQQMLKQKYKKRVGGTDYFFTVYLGEDDKVIKVLVQAIGE